MKQRYLLALFLFVTTLARAQQFPGGFSNPGQVGQSRPGQFPGMNAPGQSNQMQQPSGRRGLDDSTKQIYGPRTARYFLESDVFNNRKRLYITDTLIDGVQQFTFVQRNQNRYVDLGNLGTPLRPVFYDAPEEIGATMGYDVFSPYANRADQVRYYDTKSPFTDMRLVLGGRNQNILNFSYNQNITSRWNLGFSVQRFTSQKQFGTAGTGVNLTQRLLAQNWTFLAHTNYRSKNDRYTLLLHFNHLNHQVAEQGGVLPGQRVVGNTTETVTFNYDDDARARLNVAQSNEIRNNWHVYHQYKLAGPLQVFQKLDYKRHINTFTDSPLSSIPSGLTFADSVFWGARNIRFDSSRIFQDVRYRLLDNTAGLKGVWALGKSAFNYRAYARQRFYGQFSRYNVGDTTTQSYELRRLETFVGGWLGYYFPDSLSRLTAQLEYELGGGYRLQGQLETKLGTVGYSSILARPTLQQEQFISNIYQWQNNFGLRGTQHLYARLNLTLGRLTLRPEADYFLLNNFIYFDSTAAPQQLSRAFSVLRVGTGATYRLGRFQTSAEAYFSTTTRADVLRLPTLFVNGRIQYEFIYAKVLNIQAGLDLHYQTAYFGDAYNPLLQQFTLQNRQLTQGYVLADAFANFRVNRVRLFVKMSHVNQGVFAPGYFLAPGFIQIRRGFGFGVYWYLFD